MTHSLNLLLFLRAINYRPDAYDEGGVRGCYESIRDYYDASPTLLTTYPQWLVFVSSLNFSKRGKIN